MPPAHRVTRRKGGQLGLQVPRALDLADHEPAVENRFVIEHSSQRVGQVDLREDHRRLLREIRIDHTVGSEVNKREPGQLARGSQALERALACLGAQQDPGRPVISREDLGQGLDLKPGAGQG